VKVRGEASRKWGTDWSTPQIPTLRGTDSTDGCGDPGDETGAETFKMYGRDGLFLLVNAGGSKLWRWRYRFDGKEELMALGEYLSTSRVSDTRLQIQLPRVVALAPNASTRVLIHYHIPFGRFDPLQLPL
jgi:hypothetical protein